MNGRYVIEVRSTGRGRRVVERLSLANYDEALDQLDSLERRYGDTFEVEFRDTGISRR